MAAFEHGNGVFPDTRSVILLNKPQGMGSDQFVFRISGNAAELGIDVPESRILDDVAADHGIVPAAFEFLFGLFPLGIVPDKSFDGNGLPFRIPDNRPFVVHPSDRAVRTGEPVFVFTVRAPLLQGQRGVRIDDDSRRVWVQEQELDPPLSSAQFALLRELVRSPGLVHSRDKLRAIAWPDESPDGISDEAVNSLIRRLRRRLMEIDPGHRYIYAIRGHGFKFEQPE